MNSHLAEVPGGTLYYQTGKPDPCSSSAAAAPHSDDLRCLIAYHGTGPATVFGTSFGALIALDVAATAPAAIGTLIVHDPRSARSWSAPNGSPST